VVPHSGMSKLSEPNERRANGRRRLPGAGLPLRGVAADEGDLPVVVVQVFLVDQAPVRLVSRLGPRNQQVAKSGLLGMLAAPILVQEQII
jgi:hypothetical protein